MNNAPCNEKECPMMELRMPYCFSTSETEAPCSDMAANELENLRLEIDENNHDKGE